MENDTTAQQMLEAMPFAKLLNIKLDGVSKVEVKATLAWREELTTTGGSLHGGVIMGFADAVGALLAFINLPPGAGTTTIESKTNFLKASPEGTTLTAVSKLLGAGKSLIVVQTNLLNPKGQLVAQVTQTQIVLGGSKL
jgi:1,4-dihydroxy-2-naphthoyl-CoA hydrolase